MLIIHRLDASGGRKNIHVRGFLSQFSQMMDFVWHSMHWIHMKCTQKSKIINDSVRKNAGKFADFFGKMSFWEKIFGDFERRIRKSHTENKNRKIESFAVNFAILVLNSGNDIYKMVWPVKWTHLPEKCMSLSTNWLKLYRCRKNEPICRKFI